MNVIDETLAMMARLELVWEEIAFCKRQISKLSELEREYAALHKGVIKTLSELDVMQSGNTGWEMRSVNFLVEFRKRLLDQSISTCSPDNHSEKSIPLTN
jgi:hypothetical protein